MKKLITYIHKHLHVLTNTLYTLQYRYIKREAYNRYIKREAYIVLIDYLVFGIIPMLKCIA